jgi:hypothetical protein
VLLPENNASVIFMLMMHLKTLAKIGKLWNFLLNLLRLTIK